jgi:hypothetical protein
LLCILGWAQTLELAVLLPQASNCRQAPSCLVLWHILKEPSSRKSFPALPSLCETWGKYVPELTGRCGSSGKWEPSLFWSLQQSVFRTVTTKHQKAKLSTQNVEAITENSVSLVRWHSGQMFLIHQPSRTGEGAL